MKTIVKILFIIFLFFTLSCENTKDEIHKKKESNRVKFGLVIHGGAGNVTRGRYTAEEEKKHIAKLNEALSIGYEILKEGGTALDAVENTIKVLEDSPLFNAGKGAVFTSNGINELDAAIMDGKTLEAGAVAGIKHIKNPITLARKVMENSKHVMLVGEGAEIFAKEQNLEIVNNEYFHTDKRWQSLQKIKAEERKKKSKNESGDINKNIELKFGTVGCAALDKDGNLAAGTSTGGMTNKKYGRVGDVPIIGAGTYANNNTCALSATGHGEYFIRNVVTHDISALMEYKNLSINEAAREVVMNKLVKQNGSGGVIGIDKNGNITMTLNSKGMFRGFITDEGKSVVKMYED